jgi:multiple antibiotic resistance protein
MTLLDYTLLATGSLFLIVDPLATVPAFLSLTARETPEHRAKTAQLACLIMGIVLVLFATLGSRIFSLFGITLTAFQFAASIVLLMIALDMLRAQRSRMQETHEDIEAAALKEDIAVTPLAIPMLAGPGAISTVVVLHNQARDAFQHIALVLSIVAVSAATYVILHLSSRGAQWLNPIALRIATRVMGLVLAAIAVQFMIDAVAALRTAMFQAVR